MQFLSFNPVNLVNPVKKSESLSALNQSPGNRPQFDGCDAFCVKHLVGGVHEVIDIFHRHVGVLRRIVVFIL